MKKTALILRILFGLDFLLNGINFYFDFIPLPDTFPSIAQLFIDALVQTGIIEIVKFLEVAIGISMLCNRFVPLALILAMPITISVLYMDVVLVGGFVAAVLFGFGTFVLNTGLLLLYLPYYHSLLVARAEPSRPSLPGAISPGR